MHVLPKFKSVSYNSLFGHKIRKDKVTTLISHKGTDQTVTKAQFD